VAERDARLGEYAVGTGLGACTARQVSEIDLNARLAGYRRCPLGKRAILCTAEELVGPRFEIIFNGFLIAAEPGERVVTDGFDDGDVTTSLSRAYGLSGGRALAGHGLPNTFQG
jgi:hypothetical protein